MLSTNAPEHNCVACQEFIREYKLVADSAKSALPAVFFTVLNFQKAQDVFQSVPFISIFGLIQLLASNSKCT